MNNSELFVAIDASFKMIQAIQGNYAEEKKMLIKHFDLLLTEQIKRVKENKND